MALERETDTLFLDPGELVDGDLHLVLTARLSGDPRRGYVPAYDFEMRRLATSVPMGYIHLRNGQTKHVVMYAGHIGYCVATEFRGHRYAARSCKLLLPLARAHGLNPLWITCNPDNLASRRTCELLGARLVEIVPTPKDSEMYLSGERYKCRYRLDL